MSACEECWAEAFRISRRTGASQVDEYHRLIAETNHQEQQP